MTRGLKYQVFKAIIQDYGLTNKDIVESTGRNKVYISRYINDGLSIPEKFLIELCMLKNIDLEKYKQKIITDNINVRLGNKK
jgi:hypothetical protein